MRPSFAAACFIGAMLRVVACKTGEPPDQHTSFVACEEISVACHNLDDGAASPARECHGLAHRATDEATCLAKRADCLADCGAEAAAGDAGGGG